MQSWRYTRVTRLLYQPGRNSAQFKQTSFVSQQHWTAHSSTQMQPQLWNKASLPCRTVPLYCHCPLLHCCPWMSLVVICHDGHFNWGHVSAEASKDNWYLHKTPLSSSQYTRHAKECSRTGQQSWRAEIPNVCPHCAEFLSISCSHYYREVGGGPGEPLLESWLSVHLDLTAMAWFQTISDTAGKRF